MNRRYSPITNIGSVSLLMTFIVLCLAVFATLSLSASISEYQYSLKIAEHNQEYYQASSAATQTLREIDRLLHAAYSSSPDIYYEVIEEQLTSMGTFTLNFGADKHAVSYEVPISDSQLLRVCLSLNEPSELKDGFYKITTWQEVPSSLWNGDDSLNLLTL